jgi:hypothetical protein
VHLSSLRLHEWLPPLAGSFRQGLIVRREFITTSGEEKIDGHLLARVLGPEYDVVRDCWRLLDFDPPRCASTWEANRTGNSTWRKATDDLKLVHTGW